jgi:hypothetical protein
VKIKNNRYHLSIMNNKFGSMGNGGYVGMLALVVVIGIVCLLFARQYFAPLPTPPPELPTSQVPQSANSSATTTATSAVDTPIVPLTASGTPAKSQIEQYHADVDAAKAIQQKLNAKNAETNAEMAQ